MRRTPSADAVFDDDRVHLVAGAAIPRDRAGIGLRAMEHGKHYFTDKPPMTSLDQLAAVRATAARTGRFGELILDCLGGTERAMTQEHAFRVTELCLTAQAQAVRVEG